VASLLSLVSREQNAEVAIKQPPAIVVELAPGGVDVGVDCTEPRALAKPPHTLGHSRHNAGLNWKGFVLRWLCFERCQRDKFAFDTLQLMLI
jgi:hypothetical protein